MTLMIKGRGGTAAGGRRVWRQYEIDCREIYEKSGPEPGRIRGAHPLRV